MSDGNFNRALLPHTPYQSGLKAGKAMARMHAAAALRDTLLIRLPDMSEAERMALCNDFTARLTSLLQA